MPLLGPAPQLPPRRRAGPPLGSTAATSSVGTASIAFDAQGSAPFGAGAAAVSLQATGAGARIISAAGSASIAIAGTATSTNIFPLAVSADGRTFVQADGTPFLIAAQTTWSLAVNIPLAGVASFLNGIIAQGFSAVMMNAIEHHYTTANPPKERSGLLPFTKTLNGASYTGSPDGTTGAAGTQGQFPSDPYTASISVQGPDPTFINNNYWLAVEQVLNACLARNVLVFVWPAYLGFHVNDEGWLNEMVVWDGITGAGGFTGFSFADPSKSKMWNYGAWLADRWKAYPNLVWVMGGDYGANSQSLNTQQRAAVTNCMLGLKSVAGQASTMFSAHWDRPCLSTDTPLTSGAFALNFAYADDATSELTRRGYAVTPTIPVILGEYFYEAGLFGGSAPYRRYNWWGILGGIAGTFFGHEQLWRFDDGTPGTDFTTLSSTQGTLDIARLFAFWRSKPWWRLKPSGLGGMGTLVTVGGGTESPQSSTFVAAAATSEGDLLLAYVPPAHTGSITVDMTKLAATARARWFDPTNATFTDIGEFANTGTRAFTPPASNSAGDADFVLVLETTVGTAAMSMAAAGVGAWIAAVAGSAAVSMAGAGVGRADAVATGSASIAIAAAGVSGTVTAGVGTAAAALAATAAGARIVTAAGAAAVNLAASGVLVAGAAGAGAAAVTTTAAAVGVATGTGPAVGAAAFSILAAAVGAAFARGAGTASIGITAAAVAASAAVPSTFADLVADMDRVVLEELG